MPYGMGYHSKTKTTQMNAHGGKMQPSGSSSSSFVKNASSSQETMFRAAPQSEYAKSPFHRGGYQKAHGY